VIIVSRQYKTRDTTPDADPADAKAEIEFKAPQKPEYSLRGRF